MKKFARIFTIAAVALGLSGAVACSEDDDKKETPSNNPETPFVPDGEYTESEAYAIVYNNDTLTAGQMVEYTATAEDIENDQVTIRMDILNKTRGELSTWQQIVMVQGPSTMASPAVCGGGMCPWDGEPYTLAPGVNTDKFMAIEFTPSKITRPATAYFQITVGTGRELTDPQVNFLKVTI